MRPGFLLQLLSTSLRASVALRGAFLLQVLLMALNNLFFFSTWWILFRRFDHIGDWTLADMMLLFGVSATGFGVAAVTCGGMFELARAIAEGDLDALLCQPKSVLLRAVASRSRASGWGDIASGAGMLAISGYLRWDTAATTLLAIALAAITLIASCVALHSSAFWLGRVETLARQTFEFVLFFSLYPPPLFGFGMRVLLFTLLPAGFVAYLPVELIRHFDPSTALWTLAGVASHAAFACWLFARGLERYESGSRFGAWG